MNFLMIWDPKFIKISALAQVRAVAIAAAHLEGNQSEVRSQWPLQVVLTDLCCLETNRCEEFFWGEV